MSTCLVYDSGTGGAWFSLQLLKRKKANHVVFYADTGHFPLGLKSETQLYTFLSDFFNYAEMLKPGSIFLACNTISSVFLRYWPVFKRDRSIPLMHTYSFHNGLIQLSKPLILATEATVKARIYTYFTGGRGEEIPATELIGALQRDDADAISSLVSSFSEYAKVHAFSDVVMGCTHLSEVADLFKMQGLSVYDPLSRVLDAAPCLYVEGDKLSLTVHATGDPTDVLNYVNRRISALPEEVLLDAEY